MKKTIYLFLLLTSINSFSQSKYSIRVDFVKSLFGVYQTELEYELNKKNSLGIGFLYMNTDTMLIFNDEDSKTTGFMINPFYRHYNNSNSESSSFYQANIRFFNYLGFADNDGQRRNIISLDFVYGYQFKISERFFLEPSIGLGAFRKINGKNKYFAIPYPVLNFNASIKL